MLMTKIDITTRNFFTLIRCGAFNTTEQVEPMSASKWQHLFMLAVAQDVAPQVFAGIDRCKDQFFMHLTEQQWKQWRDLLTTIHTDDSNDTNAKDDKLLRPDQLTNPVLNRKLQHILDDEHSDNDTREMLLRITGIVRSLLNNGISLRQMVDLGKMTRDSQRHVDYQQLNNWIRLLHLQSIAQLIGELMMSILNFDKAELGFMSDDKQVKNVSKVRDELLRLTSQQAQDFYFSQAQGDIFVHGNGSSAMIGHVKRSAQYFCYYPSETITNFFASFAHSLSHIEE